MFHPVFHYADTHKPHSTSDMPFVIQQFTCDLLLINGVDNNAIF